MPCSRWVWMPLSISSTVPEVKEAPPPPWLCMSTKPGTTQWPRTSSAAGVSPAAACPDDRGRSSTIDPAVLDGPGGQHHPGAGENGRVRRVRPSGGYLRGESESQASRPAPRHPAVSPRAAGTIVGQCLERDPLLDGGAQWCEQGFPRLGETATDDQGAGVEQGERGDQAGRRARRPRPARPVPARGSPASTACAQSAASASGSPHAAAQARVTAAAEASGSRQPRWPQPQAGAVGAYHDVADLARVAVRAGLDAAVDADGARRCRCRAGRRGSGRRPGPRRSGPRRARRCARRARGPPGCRRAARLSRSRSGTSRQPRLAEYTAIPRSASTMPGTATPAARRGSPKCSLP